MAVTTSSRIDDQLQRAKLLADLIGSSLAAWMIFDMMNHGQISYRLEWHLRRFHARREQRRRARREWIYSLGVMFYQAEQALREGQDSHG